MSAFDCPRSQHRSRGDAAPGAPRAPARPGTRRARRRAGRRRQPSRCTCARTGATSRTATCASCAPCSTTRMNLEMAVTDEMLAIAAEVRPADCCLVPEKRAELTTEGGLDVAGQAARIRGGGGHPGRRRNPRRAVRRPRGRADRGSRGERRARRRAAHRGVLPRRAAAARPPSSSGCVRRPGSPPRLGLEVHAGHGLELSQRAARGRDRRDRRAQHRPCDRGARGVRRARRRRSRDMKAQMQAARA